MHPPLTGTVVVLSVILASMTYLLTYLLAYLFVNVHSNVPLLIRRQWLAYGLQ